MLRLRHSALLVWQVAGYARLNRAWWLLLLLPLALLVLAVTATTQVVVPYTVYTVF